MTGFLETDFSGVSLNKIICFLILFITFSLLGTPFSAEHAFSIKEQTETLKTYLDSTDPLPQKELFYFIYYKRKALYMPAVMSLINYVNQTDSYSDIQGYENLYDTILQNAPEIHMQNNIELYKKGIDLKSQSTELKLSDIDMKFFLYMKELSDYVISKNAQVPNYIILSKGMSLIFTDISSGINWEGDEHLHSVWNQYLKMNREGTLESYLSFFFFFTKKENYGLPSKNIYFNKLSESINLFKEGTSLDSVENDIKTLIVATYVKNFRKLPEIMYISEKEFNDKSNTLKRNYSECSYLKNRAEMFKSMGEIYTQAFKESDALEIINNCAEDNSIPIIFDKDKIYIEKENAFLTDIAIVISFANKGIIKKEDINIYLNIATLSAIVKYKSNKNKSSYGKELYYAYFTNRLKEYISSRFIYGFIKNPEQITKELDSYLGFISDFYSGG